MAADTLAFSLPAVDGAIGIRAKSSFEESFNPFGDEWSTKMAPNSSIPVGLTPGCHRRGQKADNLVPNAEETTFISRTNNLILWEECGDPMEYSPNVNPQQRNGDPVLKNYITSVKQKNPNVKYIGYMNSIVHSTASLGAPVTPVGLLDFEPKESYFLHFDGAAETKANRVKFTDGRSDVYDFTNAAFRQDMANHLKASLDYHEMDGIVVDACFDRPLFTGTPPSQAKINAWTQGCLDLLTAMKQTMPNKLFFPTGFKHIGTEGQPETINGPAAFQLFAQRVDRTDGFYWEDPMGVLLTNQPTNQVYIGNITRYRQVQDYVVQQGKYLGNAVNTNAQGQSSFPTTNREQQLNLSRFYLAAHLTQFVNDKNVMHLWTPTGLQIGETFVSVAHWRDWDWNIGTPTGNATQPAGADVAIWQRDFQRARVVLNSTSNTFTVSLPGGQYKTLDGQTVTSFNLPPKSGMVFLLPGSDPIPVAPPEQTACTPRPKVQTTVTQVSPGVLQVTLTTVNGQGGYIRSVTIDAPRNATVDFVGGVQGASTASTHTALAGTTSQVVMLRRVNGGAYTVQMTVTDGCGTWKTLAGRGPA